jgi:hypothetical protein
MRRRSIRSMRQQREKKKKSWTDIQLDGLYSGRGRIGIGRVVRKTYRALCVFCAMLDNEKKVCVGIFYMGSVHMGVV